METTDYSNLKKKVLLFDGRIFKTRQFNAIAGLTQTSMAISELLGIFNTKYNVNLYTKRLYGNFISKAHDRFLVSEHHRRRRPFNAKITI